MKATLLLLEGVEKEIENEVRNQLGGQENLSDYDRVVAEINGKVDENQQQSIFVDMTKFFKTTDFYFKKTDVKGLFMSTKVTKVEDKIMVIIVDGQEYDCLFNETIFEELARSVVAETVKRNENLPATEAIKITTMAGCSAVKK